VPDGRRPVLTYLWHVRGVLGEARHEPSEHPAYLHVWLQLRADCQQRLQGLQVELVREHLGMGALYVTRWRSACA
jgi:hypothetical protein